MDIGEKYFCDHSRLRRQFCTCLSRKMLHIDELHYSYLHEQANLQKLAYKARLEDLIREYLMMAPHEKKFIYHETALILHRSAQVKEHFSGIRASSAWSAIASYAHNLLAQSWRREFREVQIHCGYYKHNVERGLIGADVMLVLMGYTDAGDGRFLLEGPVDPDRVALVSRDSLVAMVECQILCSLYSDLLRRGCNFSWIEILEFREKHPCSIEHALQGLMYEFNQRYIRSAPLENYAKYSTTDRNIYNPPYRIHNNLQVPYYIKDATDGLPVPGPSYIGSSHGLPCSTSMKDYTPSNSISAKQSNHCTVPTGKLIELDVPYHSISSHEMDNQPKPLSDVHNPTLNLNDGNSNKINKDAGWETWGASYQPAENKKSNYDLITDRNKVDDYDWEEAFKALNFEESPSKAASTALDSKGVEKPLDKQLDKSFDKSSRKKLKLDPNLTQTLGRDLTKKPDLKYMSLKVNLNDKWECPACTFHNSNDIDVCEMCSKSKTLGHEVQPLVSGGRQCPKCTLVNEKGVTECDACGENLKDSPTYI